MHRGVVVRSNRAPQATALGRTRTPWTIVPSSLTACTTCGNVASASRATASTDCESLGTAGRARADNPLRNLRTRRRRINELLEASSWASRGTDKILDESTAGSNVISATFGVSWATGILDVSVALSAMNCSPRPPRSAACCTAAPARRLA